MTTLVDIFNGSPGSLLEKSQTPGFGGVRHIYEMMGDALAFLRGGLGGTDIEAAIEKAGIG